MKRCEEVVPLLGPMLDGALQQDDLAWVDDHVRGCARCRDRMALTAAQAQAIRDSVRTRAARIDLERLSDRVLARVRDDARRAPPSVWGRELWWAHKGGFMAGAGVALAACIALGVFFAPARGADDVLLAENGSQVEQVDFGTRDGAVLQLPGQTTVIWMSDDRAVQQ